MLIGRVQMAARSSVWFNAVLRGDNDWIRIGEGSNVQDCAVIHVDNGFPVTIGEECIIGHSAVVHGCTLGNRVLIGINATILNRAYLPDDVVIAAGGLVPEGSQLESGFLYTGVPVKKVRPLRMEDLERMKRGAQSYQEKAQKYQLHLKG